MEPSLPKVDRAALREKMLAEFERTLEAVVDAVDKATPGRIIRESEEPARVALDGFRSKLYEAALQAKVDAAEAAFPPSEERGDGRHPAS
jgi:hypothetical protein